MTWIAQRSRVKKIIECYSAARFARAHGAPRTNPRQLRGTWLYGRFNLLPRNFEFAAGPVLDVGANTGDWTAALLRLVPRATVVALEPSPDLVIALKARFSGNRSVRIIGQAVSDVAGELNFHVTANSHNSSLMEPRDMNREYNVTTGWEEVKTITVPTTTLDSLLPQLGPPSLVKIDVQGAEALVLKGAAETLKVARAVVLEMTARSHYVNDSPSEELDRLLVAAGYRHSGVSDVWLDAETGEALWYDACYLNGRYYG